MHECVRDVPTGRTTFKEWVEIFQGLFTIGALIVAGIWFIAQKNLKPQIKLEQTISQRACSGRPGYWLVAIDVRATNTGKVNVSLSGGSLLVTQINPIPGEDLKKKDLKDIELDPGETDQALFITIVVPDYIHTIEATSTYKVPGANANSWQLITSAEVGDGKPDKTIASSID